MRCVFRKQLFSGKHKAIIALENAVATPNTQENAPQRMEAMSLLGAHLHDAGRLDEAVFYLQHIVDIGAAQATELVNLAGKQK